MPDQADSIFPVDAVPREAPLARLAGIYPQRQEGMYMQRVRLSGGRITAARLRALAQIVRRYTPGYPIHLTTRQDIELHGIPQADVPAVQRAMHQAGLTGASGCGDSLRNITSCPESGLVPLQVDAAPIARVIEDSAFSLPWVMGGMPRKFKISISTCRELCARPYVSDLGLVARPDGTFGVIGAGSLGARPATGIRLYDEVDPHAVVALVVAALRLFNEHGNREDRRKARLRHVRERWGDQRFREALDQAFRRELRRGSWPAVPVQAAEGCDELHAARLQLLRGDLPPESAEELADLGEGTGGVVRIGLEHNVHVFTARPLQLPASLERLRGGPRIVACPGSDWCRNGLVSSRSTEDDLRTALGSGPDLLIGISGCPNNCAHAAIADVGLIGCLRTVEGERRQHYRLLAGGGVGKGPALARQIEAAVPAEKVGKAVSALLDR